jgi:probable rRNA maturation factor
MSDPPSRMPKTVAAGPRGRVPVSSRLVVFRRVPAAVPRATLERFARDLRDEVADGHEFECLITSDRELRRLNREFRGKDEPTDVLSFPAAQTPAAGQEIRPALGELAVSWERAEAQAAEYGHALESELRILMLHGVLHLLGMDHETDRGRMARVEARWRLRFHLPNGLIERARQ